MSSQPPSNRAASPWVRKSLPLLSSLFPTPSEGAQPLHDASDEATGDQGAGQSNFVAHGPQRDRAEADLECDGDAAAAGGDFEALPDSRTLLGEVVSVLQHTRKIMQKTVNMLKNLSKKPDVDPDTVWVLETAVEMLISHRPPITASLNRLKLRLTAPDSHPVLGPKLAPYPTSNPQSQSQTHSQSQPQSISSFRTPVNTVTDSTLSGANLPDQLSPPHHNVSLENSFQKVPG